ncbi:PepSY domain-containing protein [Ilumatobacter sp.]|uniref:PepSY domain-containing protein n=2 Tax=Ilumatobacter sp. TaxID=1967498 RepID=UPI0037537A14
MRITKRSVFSGLAGVGFVLGAGGLAAAASATNVTNVTPVSAAVLQQVDPTVDQANQVDDESAETPEHETDQNETDQNETDQNETDQNETDEGHESGENDGPETAPTYTSSVQTTPEVEVADAMETDESEAAADAARAALATLTPDEASVAALASQAGTVQDVELSNKAGNVVYEVTIVDASGTEFEVIIDAGNGAVLDSAAE